MRAMKNAGKRGTPPPADYLKARGKWPDGPFQRNTPAYALAIAKMVRNLRNEMEAGGLSLREVARRTNLAPATLSTLLNGQHVPDTATLARLEHGLGVPLWDNSNNES